MSIPRIPLVPDTFFHIYNHAVGNENLFIEERNYHCFLDKLKKWIVPLCDIYAYSLMPNHFHLILHIKEDKYLKMLWEEKISLRLSKSLIKPGPPYNKQVLDDDTFQRIQQAAIIEKLINEQFSHCFNSYVQTFNCTYNRKGSLMLESFCRKVIDSDDYLNTLICYVHNNPVIHGFTNKASEWVHSSYNSFFNENDSFIEKVEVLKLFEDLDNFIYVHNEHLLALL